VVKTTCFLTDINDFAAFNEVYREFFPSDPPARSTVQAGLVGSYVVEIEAIAVLPE
jgi:2-iminobutanoate/2-iminopropanoate deaminase